LSILPKIKHFSIFILHILLPILHSFTHHSALILLIVELEGFEPSSKHGINMLSTCLVCHWLSGNTRGQTPKIFP